MVIIYCKRTYKRTRIHTYIHDNHNNIVTFHGGFSLFSSQSVFSDTTVLIPTILREKKRPPSPSYIIAVSFPLFSGYTRVYTYYTHKQSRMYAHTHTQITHTCAVVRTRTPKIGDSYYPKTSSILKDSANFMSGVVYISERLPTH